MLVGIHSGFIPGFLRWCRSSSIHGSKAPDLRTPRVRPTAPPAGPPRGLRSLLGPAAGAGGAAGLRAARAPGAPGAPGAAPEAPTRLGEKRSHGCVCVWVCGWVWVCFLRGPKKHRMGAKLVCIGGPATMVFFAFGLLLKPLKEGCPPKKQHTHMCLTSREMLHRKSYFLTVPSATLK